MKSHPIRAALIQYLLDTRARGHQDRDAIWGLEEEARDLANLTDDELKRELTNEHRK